MPRLQVLESNPSFGAQLGQTLGAGLGQGIASQISSYMQNKANTSAATSLADQFGVKGQQRQSMIDFLKNVPAQDQPKAIQDYATAQVLGQYLNANQQSNQQPERTSQGQNQMSGQQQPQASAGLEMAAGIPLSETAIMREKPSVPPIPGVLANIAKEQQLERHHKENISEEGKKRHFDLAKPTLERVRDMSESLPLKESSLLAMEDAIKNRNLGFFSRDNLAELTGVEGFRSPEGSVFKSASKEFLMGNLSRVGAKGLNQWLEKQVESMSAKLGRETSANLAATEFLKTELDIQKKQIELTNKIADYQESHGGIKRTLADDVRKQLTPYAIEKQKELKKNVEDIQSRYKKSTNEGILMRDPAGNLRRVPLKEVKKARSDNYTYER